MKQQLAAMMMMAAMSNPGKHRTYKEPKIKKPIKKIIPNGLTEFFYGKNSLWALNQKTADKKAIKKGYINQ